MRAPMASADNDKKIMREARMRALQRRAAARDRLRAMAGQIPAMRNEVEFGTPDRVEWHIENWRAWIESGDMGEIGTRLKTAVGLSSGGASQRFTDMVQLEDRKCALATHGIISSLPERERLAIYIYTEQLPAVFRFRTPYEEALASAKAAIGRALKFKAVW